MGPHESMTRASGALAVWNPNPRHHHPPPSCRRRYHAQNVRGTRAGTLDDRPQDDELPLQHKSYRSVELRSNSQGTEPSRFPWR